MLLHVHFWCEIWILPWVQSVRPGFWLLGLSGFLRVPGLPNLSCFWCGMLYFEHRIKRSGCQVNLIFARERLEGFFDSCCNRVLRLQLPARCPKRKVTEFHIPSSHLWADRAGGWLGCVGAWHSSCESALRSCNTKNSADLSASVYPRCVLGSRGHLCGASCCCNAGFQWSLEKRRCGLLGSPRVFARVPSGPLGSGVRVASALRSTEARLLTWHQRTPSHPSVPCPQRGSD